MCVMKPLKKTAYFKIHNSKYCKTINGKSKHKTIDKNLPKISLL